MGKSVSKASATAAGKSAKPKQAKPAAAVKQTTSATPNKPVKKRKLPARPRATKASALQTAFSSLHETATEIVSDRIQPTIDQIKALALAVIGHEEKKAKKAQTKAAKPAKPTKAKKSKTDAPTTTAVKPKKK